MRSGAATANLIAATSDTGAFVICAACSSASPPSFKISNDLRLLSSGPGRAWPTSGCGAPGGLVHHAGQVSPVIPEAMNQVLRGDGQRRGHHQPARPGSCSSAPSSRWSPGRIHKSLHHLARAPAVRCRSTWRSAANQGLLDERIAASVTLTTALNPVIGYEKAAAIAKAISPCSWYNRGGRGPGHHGTGRDAEAPGGRAADPGRVDQSPLKLSKK